MKTHAHARRPLPPLRRASATHRASTGDFAAQARVRQVLHGSRLQAKLTVGPPDDAYEREADRVADAVMRMPEPEGRVQRVCAECEEEMEDKGVVRRVCTECSPEILQRQGPPAGPIDSLEAAEKKVATVAGGRPLEPDDRAFFEPRLASDLGRVRVHDDSAADAAARSVGALAYTRGRDIVFRSGSYAPNTDRGRRLLAHELTHVLQQGAAGPAIPGTSATATLQASPQDTLHRAVDEDGKEAAPAPSPEQIRPAQVSTDEAARIGREALESTGYEGILRQALAAGILKPQGAPEEAEVQRMPDPGLLQRQSFGEVFSRYAVAAGIASQVDSPAPGPGDVVAIGILVVGLFAALAASTTARPCPPCPAPPAPEIDRVPPSTPHFPCPGDHWHYYVYNQNPVTCQCFGPRRMFGGCCGLGTPGAPC